MHLPPHQNIRIRRTAPAEDAESWAAMLATLDHDPTLTELKQTDRSGVWRAEPIVAGQRRPIVAKVHAIAGVGGKAKLAAGQSKAARQWRGSAWLADHGFDTAMPLALATGSNEQGLCECLCIEALSGWTVLDYLASLGDDTEPHDQHDEPSPSAQIETETEAETDETIDPELMRSIAQAAGTDIGHLVALKRYNRDHKPSNLIVTDEAEPRIAIIDTVSIRPAGSDWSLDLVAMLKSLVLEPKGLGFEPPRWWLEVACAAALSELDQPSDGTQLADAVEYAVEVHGNPRPEDVPIRRAGRRANETPADGSSSSTSDSPGASGRDALD